MENGANPPGIELRVIELANVQMHIGRAPADPTKRAFFLGPLILQVSLTEEAAREVVKGLTGIEIPTDPKVI